MGEIIIKTPSRERRTYVLDDARIAKTLIDALDHTAIRMKKDPATAEDLENIEDARDVQKAIAEYKRTGKSHKWEDVKAELGL